jgi:signal transduction histidine kinase
MPRVSSVQLRALTRRLRADREEERKQISRDLHDVVGQLLTAVKMDVSWLKSGLPPSPALQERADFVLAQLDRSIEAVRGLCFALRPTILDEVGLEAAVQREAARFEASSRIPCRVAAHLSEIEPDGERDEALYRVLQEALTNVTRHANATRVSIDLRLKGPRVCLEIVDDGRGIAPQELSAAGSIGILGMRERLVAVGGTLQIGGTPGGGTFVHASVPFLEAVVRGAPRGSIRPGRR